MSADEKQWIDCPEVISRSANALSLCSLPAEIIRTATMQSTRGEVLHLQTRCLRGHLLFFPADMFDGLRLLPTSRPDRPCRVRLPRFLD